MTIYRIVNGTRQPTLVVPRSDLEFIMQKLRHLDSKNTYVAD